MVEISSFFRHCPSCGRRFQIKLVSKKLVDVKRETVEKTMNVGPSPITRMGMGTSWATSSWSPLIVQESVPVEVDIESFQYQYKCSHCGHEWSENRVEESRE